MSNHIRENNESFRNRIRCVFSLMATVHSDHIFGFLHTRALPHFFGPKAPKNEKIKQFSVFYSIKRHTNHAKEMFECYLLIIIHPKDTKKLQALSICLHRICHPFWLLCSRSLHSKWHEQIWNHNWHFPSYQKYLNFNEVSSSIR